MAIPTTTTSIPTDEQLLTTTGGERHCTNCHPSALPNGTSIMSNQAFNLPNLLTYGRILAVPLIVMCFYVEGSLGSSERARWSAVYIFAAAAVTDYLDGYLARIWEQTSNIGKMLDPIADKLLVITCLLLLAANGTISGWSLWAAIIILCREVLVSGLRECLATLKVSIPATQLARWKTMFQMVAIACLLVGPAGDAFLPAGYTMAIGIGLLWISAIVTFYSGYNYYRAGLRHMMADDGTMPVKRHSG